MIPIDKIENTETCFVQLWLMLEQTRQLLAGQYKLYCIRRVLKAWFGLKATDDFIFEVCLKSELFGYDQLNAPMLDPRPHRELLRAVVATVLDIGMRQVDLHALDAAYRIAYPDGITLNVNKE